MLMLVLQRANLPVAVLQARFLVVVGLLQAGILDLGLLAQLLFLQQCLLGSCRDKGKLGHTRCN